MRPFFGKASIAGDFPIPTEFQTDPLPSAAEGGFAAQSRLILQGLHHAGPAHDIRHRDEWERSMSTVINLNKARKRKAREAAEKQAAENRVRHGRTKAEKQRDRAEAEEAKRRLDQLKRDSDPETD
jgi:hypothetical protein